MRAHVVYAAVRREAKRDLAVPCARAARGFQIPRRG
jgi:hypothetical protein